MPRISAPKQFLLAFLVVIFGITTNSALSLVTTCNRIVTGISRPSISKSRGVLTMRKGRPSTKNVGKGGKKKDEKSSANSNGPAYNWLPVAANEEELPSGEGDTKAVTLPGGLVVMLRRTQGTVRCMSSSCTKCKYPLLNAAYEEETNSIVCGVCGSKYSVTSGELTGREEKNGLAGMLGNVMSSTKGGPISAYSMKKDTDGTIFAAIGYK